MNVLIFVLHIGVMMGALMGALRLGKEALVAMVEAILRGGRKLFDNTWLGQADYDWPVHPVIHLDFSNLDGRSTQRLLSSLNESLLEVAATYGLELASCGQPVMTLQTLLWELAKNGKPVILIDEYDRPLVRNLSDPELAEANSREIDHFFAVIKTHQEILRFTFITGVTHFSTTGLFPALDSFKDLTLHPHFETLVGFTEEEIRKYLGNPIDRIAKGMNISPDAYLEELRDRCGGYRFGSTEYSESLYNPWSVLGCLSGGTCSSGYAAAPLSFPLEGIREDDFLTTVLEKGLRLRHPLGANRGLYQIDIASWLFHAGYLAISRYDPADRSYHLAVPNEGAQLSLVNHLGG